MIFLTVQGCGVLSQGVNLKKLPYKEHTYVNRSVQNRIEKHKDSMTVTAGKRAIEGQRDPAHPRDRGIGEQVKALYQSGSPRLKKCAPLRGEPHLCSQLVQPECERT